MLNRFRGRMTGVSLCRTFALLVLVRHFVVPWQDVRVYSFRDCLNRQIHLHYSPCGDLFREWQVHAYARPATCAHRRRVYEQDFATIFSVLTVKVGDVIPVASLPMASADPLTVTL